MKSCFPSNFQDFLSVIDGFVTSACGSSVGEYPGNPLLVISQKFWLHFPFPEFSPSLVLISEGGAQAPENVFNFAAICSTATLLKTL